VLVKYAVSRAGKYFPALPTNQSLLVECEGI